MRREAGTLRQPKNATWRDRPMTNADMKNADETFENGDETKINYYHAHIYYGDDDAVREKAARLREKAWAKWPGQVRMGRRRPASAGDVPDRIRPRPVCRDRAVADV